MRRQWDTMVKNFVSHIYHVAITYCINKLHGLENQQNPHTFLYIFYSDSPNKNFSSTVFHTKPPTHRLFNTYNNPSNKTPHTFINHYKKTPTH